MAVNTRNKQDDKYLNYLKRVINDGGSYEQVPLVQYKEQYDKIMLYEPSLVLYPTAKGLSTLYTVTPNTSSANFTFSRNSIGSYFDRNGNLRMAVANEPRLDWNPSNGQFNGVLIEPAVTNTFIDYNLNKIIYVLRNTTNSNKRINTQFRCS